MRRWTRVEYDRLVELGVFDGEPLELIGGQLIVGEPQGSYHASVINVVADVIRAALPVGLAVRVQSPIALDDDSEPEPDVAVVPGANADYRTAHPRRRPGLLDRQSRRPHARGLSQSYAGRLRRIALLAFPGVRIAVSDLLP